MANLRILFLTLGLATQAIAVHANDKAQQNRADYYGQTFILSDRSYKPYGSLYYNIGLGLNSGFSQHNTNSNQFLYQGIQGPALQAGFGYEKILLNHYFIASEAHGSYAYQHHKERHNPDSASWDIQISAPLQYGVALMPGFRLNNHDVLYLASKFSILHLSKVSSLDTEENLGKDKKFSINAISYGVGYKLNLEESSSLRVDFTHTHASKTKLSKLSYERQVNEMRFLYNSYFKPVNQLIQSGLPKGGVYASAGGGLSSLFVNHTETQISNSSKLHNLEMGDTGLNASANIGYEFLLNPHLMLGLETNYLYIHNKIDSHRKQIPVALLQQGSTYQLNFTAGMPFKNGSQISALLGASIGHFEKAQQQVFNKLPRDDLGPRFSEHLYGLNLGLGYTSMISDHWALRGDFQHQVYTPYRKSTKNAQGTKLKHYDWNIQSSQMSLSIRYYL